ncbi:protein BOLA4, chloroplastic/mitochondrial [Punica granatum]|uniref:Protein BOLA4, chloroplastic/mitochondrial n=1 Tax=Punica granatum TaxID=22663 RepID=A0A6P8E216_PUNGR|nr:protein BOLA4, chloroplastic/mitochondrial [Punica granatum]
MVNVLLRPLSATRVHLLRQNAFPSVMFQTSAVRSYCFLGCLGRRVMLLPEPHKMEQSAAGYQLRCQRKPENLVSLGRSFRFSSIRAAHVNDPGSIDSPLMLSMEQKIKEQLNAESVSVKDAYGDGRHVSIEVVASCFDGQSAVNRQRMVYKAIWEELQSTVHAVDQMTTRTPAEVAAAADK